MGCTGETSGACHFALVSYIPGRLATFLDQLRFEMKPGCTLRAHVTILPPRPIDLNIAESVRQITEEARESPPFAVELGQVRVFDKSNVVYLCLRRGERALHALHENLNAGQMEYDGPFPYHPHITLAQDLTREQALALAELARKRWAEYMVVIVVTSLLPFELYEIYLKLAWWKFGLVVGNLLVVAFLVKILIDGSGDKKK